MRIDAQVTWKVHFRFLRRVLIVHLFQFLLLAIQFLIWTILKKSLKNATNSDFDDNIDAYSCGTNFSDLGGSSAFENYGPKFLFKNKYQIPTTEFKFNLNSWNI